MYCFTGCGSARLRNLHPLNMQHRRPQPGERGSGLVSRAHALCIPIDFPSSQRKETATRPRMQGKRPSSRFSGQKLNGAAIRGNVLSFLFHERSHGNLLNANDTFQKSCRSSLKIFRGNRIIYEE